MSPDRFSTTDGETASLLHDQPPGLLRASGLKRRLQSRFADYGRYLNTPISTYCQISSRWAKKPPCFGLVLDLTPHRCNTDNGGCGYKSGFFRSRIILLPMKKAIVSPMYAQAIPQSRWPEEPNKSSAGIAGVIIASNNSRV
jgi:hypothetical protein